MIKAQASLEIIIAVSLVILIFIGLFIFYINKNNETKNLDDILKLRDECMKVSNAVQSAITLGDGYTAQISTNYTINFNEGIISVISNDNKAATCSFRADLLSGEFTGKINISNDNNNIIVKNA